MSRELTKVNLTFMAPIGKNIAYLWKDFLIMYFGLQMRLSTIISLPLHFYAISVLVIVDDAEFSVVDAEFD